MLTWRFSGSPDQDGAATARIAGGALETHSEAGTPQTPIVNARSPRSPRRVLVLIKCLGYGGAEQLLLHMMRHRNEADFDYDVAFVLDDERTLVPHLEAAGVTVHSLGGRRNSDLAWMPKLRTLVRNGGYDIVHTHLPYTATLGRLVVASLPRAHRPAIVYTEHNMWDKMALALKALNRLTEGLDDRLLVVSEAARRSLPPPLRRRATVVIHGIELEPVRATVARRAELRASVRAELGLGDNAVLALTVANLRREKAYDVLLPAARAVVDRGLAVTFVAAGRGPLRADLEAEHRRLGLGDRFRFLGQRPDVLRLLAAADMFVLPSRQEGLPVALMEACATGIPIVATAVGELPSVLTDGVDALVVPPEGPEALALAIGRLAEDAALRDALAEAAEAGAGRFDVTRCVREVESIYDELRPAPVVAPT
jgi:glycosyltransferase involved in cell wall biosynthesis